MIKIGLDLDGVLADVINLWIDNTNKKRLQSRSSSGQTLSYNSHENKSDGSNDSVHHSNSTNPNKHAIITREDISSWDFWERFGIDKFDFYMQLSECWKFWQSIPCTEPDLSRSTRLLSDIGRVDIVTARDHGTHDYAKQWLQHHNVSYTDFVTVLEGGDKAALDYDVFIDDSPVNAKSMIKQNKHVVLYNQPWNKDLEHSKMLYRASSLYHAADLISGIFENKYDTTKTKRTTT